MARASDRCSNCGHAFYARCATCGREMVCGSLAAGCPQEGCVEGVLPEADMDATHGPIEEPRRG